MIRVQREDFDLTEEVAALVERRAEIGGVCTFVGLVRDWASNPARPPLRAMTLEHYPAMTERELAAIDVEAGRRWELLGTRIIHRYGRLAPGDRIVLVAVAGHHRDPAFDACRFIIDCLKARAPFWKYEETAAGGAWVEPCPADERRALARWDRLVPWSDEP